jgi:SAM-dependent methyltransferase
MANEKWEFDDDKRRRLALGVAGVKDGETDDEAVVRSRHARLPEVSSRLALGRNDRVIDLGSGMGYLAEVVAPKVRSLVCVDISSSFRERAQARHEQKGLKNVEHVLTEYADFSKHIRRRRRRSTRCCSSSTSTASTSSTTSSSATPCSSWAGSCTST